MFKIVLVFIKKVRLKMNVAILKVEILQEIAKQLAVGDIVYCTKFELEDSWVETFPIVIENGLSRLTLNVDDYRIIEIKWLKLEEIFNEKEYTPALDSTKCTNNPSHDFIKGFFGLVSEIKFK